MFQVSYFLTINAAMHPERLALVCRGREFTWRELNEESNRIARGLLRAGIGKGDRLAIMFDNIAEFLTMFYATQKIGVCILAINTHFLSDEIARIANLVDLKALFYQQKYEEAVRGAVAEVPSLKLVVCEGEQTLLEGASLMSRFGVGESTDHIEFDLADGDESQIILTSGTTGTAKIVIKNQRMTRDYALKLALENENVFAPEVLLTRCPLFHTGGMSQVLRAAALGGTLVLPTEIDPDEIFGLVERYRVTQILMIPPLLYMRLAADADAMQRYDLSSVRMAQYTGGKCSVEFVEAIFDMFPNCRVRSTYGSTETGSPLCLLASREDIAQRPYLTASVGVLTPLYEVKIVREDGTECDVDEVGELVVRSSVLFNGYWKDEELTKRVLVDGWFHTEDLLKYDADGYYYLVDRKKDMIKTGGENVYAQEVEDMLRNHPAIFDCAVIGVDDEQFGEAVAAAIVLHEGSSISDEELIGYCKQRLPSYKKPRYVAFVESLPHNVTGKIQKSVLREQAAELFRPIEF